MLKLGEILFKYRDYTPLPFIVVMVISPAATSCSLLVGGILMLLGEAIRIHGVAYIGGVSRTRSYSTGQKVISGGPFARVRNPLYLGNLLLSAGLVAVANLSFFFPQDFLVFFVVCFFAQYIPVVAWEENNLTQKFGEAYQTYQSQVPRWLPRLSPAPTQGVIEEIKGDYPKAIKSEKNTLTTSVVLLLVVLWRSGIFAGLGL